MTTSPERACATCDRLMAAFAVAPDRFTAAVALAEYDKHRDQKHTAGRPVGR